MAEIELSKDELTALKVLGFFFYQCGNARSAEHTAKALLALHPEDAWARQFLVLCADAREDFAKVVELTDSPAAAAEDDENYAQRQRSLLLLRARALHKLGRSDESRQLLEAAHIINKDQE